jgi:hypothetical protein
VSIAARQSFSAGNATTTDAFVIKQARGGLLAVSRQLPQAAVQEQVWKAHQGLCPKCGGAGPVDVHVSHKVWSALVLTSWASTPRISCRSCGLKSQLIGTAFSLVFGWWGIP